MKSPAMKLAGTLAYILGRRPDEFGLIPDSEGYVKIKDLLKALGEEKEFRHIRKGKLDEILLTVPEPPIEIQDGRIRARDRSHLRSPCPPETLPKLLYTCIRRKAYPVVLKNGIQPTSFSHVLLSSDQDMARRIGRRNDASPVLLTVSVAQAREARVTVEWAGGSLYLAPMVPPHCFSGPPPAKVEAVAPPKATPAEPVAPRHPGSFFPDLSSIFSDESRENRDRRGTRPDWKRDRKRMTRMERKKGPRF
jgi:putative RNA 2'-phosphotransferase